MSHPQAHVLTRCIGSEPGLEVDVQKLWIWDVSGSEPLDYLLLCSDGLYSLVSDGEIANIAAANSPQRACVELVELAKSRGGYDNITVAIIPIGGQLKNEPPVGFLSRKKDAASSNNLKSKPKKNFKIGALLLGMSFLGILLAVLIMIGVLGK